MSTRFLLILLLMLCANLQAQNHILVVSSEPENLGDLAKLEEIFDDLNFTGEYASQIPENLSVSRYSLVILGEYNETDCAVLKQYLETGGGLVLTGAVPYELFRSCGADDSLTVWLGFTAYRNGSGELRASVDLSQISLPKDSLLDRTACNIGFGGLYGAQENAAVLAEWICPGSESGVPAICENSYGRGHVFYFSRLLAVVRVRALLQWALENGVEYRWGDVDNSGVINLTDAVFILRFVFSDGDTPEILNAGDPNGDGMVNVSDAVLLINYIFIGGRAPEAGRVN